MKHICIILMAAQFALAAHYPGQTIAKQTLSADGARTVIAGALREARKLHTTGAIAVVDEGGNLLMLERIDGTFPASANIAIGKAKTAALFRKPSRVFEDVVNKGRTSMAALSGGVLHEFTPLAGGVPILAGEAVIGAVGVSGAASAQEDEALALIASKALDTGMAPVTFFSGSQVDSAFAKGAVLFDSSDKYMVHASRRDKAGLAEIHTKDADIVHVLDGTATLVTGGTATNLRTIAEDEIRGDVIESGEIRQLTKGDVVIIPAGIPHWFKEVSNPFLYYVVKAR